MLKREGKKKIVKGCFERVMEYKVGRERRREKRLLAMTYQAGYGLDCL